MNIFDFDISKLPKDEQAYFQSPEFRNLSPSARIAIARQRLAPKPTAEEIAARNQRDDEFMRRIHEARIAVEEARIAAIQQRQAELKKRFLN